MIHFHFDDTVRVGAGLYTSWSGQSTPSTIGSADSGLLFDLRARLRLAAKFSLVGDARYQLGLTNRASTTTDTFKTRSVQVMGGVEVSI